MVTNRELPTRDIDPVGLTQYLCGYYASEVHLSSLEEELNPKALLWALAGNESSYGEFGIPRFEKAYAPGGQYFSRSTFLQTHWQRWGDMVACSYGPLQLMFENTRYHCPRYTPADLIDGYELCMAASVTFLNKFIGQQDPRQIKHIFDAWNTGNWKDGNIPWLYVDLGMKRYKAGFGNNLDNGG